MANDLDGLPIHFAFGGLVFNTTPQLRERIPGYFLGEDLQNVAFKVEQILNSPTKKHRQSELNASSSLEQFRDALTKIEIHVYEAIRTNPKLDIAKSRYLSRDIIAALRLGELDLISDDMEWVHGLLKNYQIPDVALREFLKIYYQAVEEHLGSNGESISIWLQSEINHLTDTENQA